MNGKMAIWIIQSKTSLKKLKSYIFVEVKCKQPKISDLLLKLLKRRGPEYFTLVLTKNDSNLVAALSYCSDEGN